MTLYDFLNIKTDEIKMTSDKMDIHTLIKSFNAIETRKDKVFQIKMNSYRFNILKEELQKDKFEGKELYRIITKKQMIFNTSIVIDDSIENEIVIFVGTKNNHENKLKLFINN